MASEPVSQAAAWPAPLAGAPGPSGQALAGLDLVYQLLEGRLDQVGHGVAALL